MSNWYVCTTLIGAALILSTLTAGCSHKPPNTLVESTASTENAVPSVKDPAAENITISEATALVSSLQPEPAAGSGPNPSSVDVQATSSSHTHPTISPSASQPRKSNVIILSGKPREIDFAPPKIPTQIVVKPVHHGRATPRIDLASIKDHDPQVLRELQTKLDQIELPGESFTVERIGDLIPTRGDRENRYLECPLALSADGTRLAILDLIEGCTIWDVPNHRKTFSFKYPADLEYPQAKILKANLDLSDDGKYLALSGYFPGVRIYEANTGKLLYTHEIPPSATDHLALLHLEISANGKWLNFFKAPQHLYRFPLLGGTGGLVATTQERYSPSKPSLAMSANGLIIALHNRKEAQTDLIRFDDPGLPSFTIPFGRWNRANYAFSHDLLAQTTDEYKLIVTSRNLDLTYWHSARKTSCFDRVAITGDEKHAVTVGKGRFVELFSTTYETKPWHFALPKVDSYEPTIHAISRDGRTIVQQVGPVHLACWKLPELPPSPEEQFAALVRDLMVQHQFEQLDALGALLEYDRDPFPWELAEPRYETYIKHINSILTDGKRLADRTYINAWLKARPTSRPARIWLAEEELHFGWKARGSGLASSVDEQAWKTFAHHLAQAREILLPLIKEENPPPHAFHALLLVARGEGWSDDKRNSLLDLFLKTAPWYGKVHQEVVLQLQPKWGGAEGAAARYADHVYRALGEKEGAEIYLQIAMATSKFYPPLRLYQSEPFDYKRMQTGLENLHHKYPNHPGLPLYELWIVTTQPTADREVCIRLLEQIDQRGTPWYYTPNLDGEWMMTSLVFGKQATELTPNP